MNFCLECGRIFPGSCIARSCGFYRFLQDLMIATEVLARSCDFYRGLVIAAEVLVGFFCKIRSCDIYRACYSFL